MPISVPNFFKAQTPLGAALNGLASTIAGQPSDAQQQQEAGTIQKQQLDLQNAQRQSSAQSKLGDLFTDPRLIDPTYSPTAAPAPPQLGDMGVASTPINRAFQPDYGQLAKTSVDAGYKPEDLGKMLLVMSANGAGARAQQTQNAQVGAGQKFGDVADAFDTTQNNDMTKAANANKTSIANNAATNLQSDTNNRRTVNAENQRAAMAREDSGTNELNPQTVKYLADQVRQGAPLPALGMGKQAAAMRSAILQQAAADDIAAGRTGTDAVGNKVDYAGNLAQSRNLGTREGTAGTAVNELAGIIPQTKALIGSVARTGLYPVDTILNAAQKGTNDPQLSKLAVSLNDAVNAHARAINPQGQVTDAGRAQGYALLNQVQSPAAMGAALDQMMLGAQRALAAPGQTRAQMHQSMQGSLGGAPAPAAPAAGGWTVQKR